MTIVAKLISLDNQSVEDVHLPDDPGESDLIEALGGDGAIVVLGWILSWEILTTTNSDRLLVVGVFPYSDVPNPNRRTCHLGDNNASNIIQALTLLFPSPPLTRRTMASNDRN